MNRCIYKKAGEPDLHFTSQDHVFPAGIGGRMTLPIGYVSDEANRELSKVELFFMRGSEILPLRLFLGPGKRGSLNPKDATQSAVHIIRQVEFEDRPSLGFISVDVPHIISQARLDAAGNCHIEIDPTAGKDHEKAMDDFLEQLREWDGTAKLLLDHGMSETVLLGYHKERWYIAGSTEASRDRARSFADLVRSRKPSRTNTSSSTPHFQTELRLKVRTSEFYRVCAKIAFNFLCMDQGPDFVLQNAFDPIRNWILGAGQNQFATPTGVNLVGVEPINDATFPEYSHKVFLFSHSDEIVAIVSFYGGYFPTLIRLAAGVDSSIFSGFICDWRNSREMTLMEYMAGLEP